MSGPLLTVLKTYRDLPCSHRAWRHGGHCRFLHGYSRSYTFWFAAREPDACGFVVDFSSLRPLKSWLDHMFDHTTLINDDDPELPLFRELHARGVIDLRVVEHCGMEGGARLCWEAADALVRAQTRGRAWCFAVEARENEKNAVRFEVPVDGSVASTREPPA
jgi:6-pyruvoyltetrahydropterin/6-carboxytetrahydropterin synthase